MTSSEFFGLCKECEQILRNAAPYKTGNLRYNAIKIEFVGNTCRLYVDEKIAPYMKYTNERWKNRAGANPNEGWFERATQKIAEHIAQRTKGDLRKI